MTETFKITVDVKAETPFAMLCDDGDQEGWIPKSLIEADQPLEGEAHELTVPVWFLEKEGWV